MRLGNSLRSTVFLLLASGLVFAACQQQAPSAPTAGPATSAAPASAPTQAPAAQPTAPATAAQPTAPAAAAAAPTAAPETIKLGISASLTGAVPIAGISIDRFVRMGIDDLNAKGGFKVGGKTYRFEPVTVDDKWTSEGGREAGNRLVLADKVKFITGTQTTPTAGMQTVTEPAKVILLPTSAVDRSLGPTFPFTLQTGAPHQRMRSMALYDWLVKAQPQAKRIAVIAPDDASGQGYVGVATEFAQARGLTVVAKELVPMTTKDFSPVVTRVLPSNPDAIDIGNIGASGPAFLGLSKALYEQGYRKTFFTITVDLASLQGGPPGTSQVVTAMPTDLTSPAIVDKQRELFARYVKAHGEAEMQPATVASYLAAPLLAQAMEKAGTVSDTEKIVQVLATGEWDTIFGKSRFGGVKTFGSLSILDQMVYLSKSEGGKPVTFDAIKVTLP